MNIKIIAFVFLFFVIKVTKAQPSLPVIIPPSPEAAAFARYGEIPVDYSTGVPNINVPIYTVKSGRIEFPINLSYHASGIKVRDVASTAGLGWVLNSNGLISRTVLGFADESSVGHGQGPYKTEGQFDSLLTAVTGVSTNGPAVASELDQYNAEYYDKQFDRYTYNFNGHAGVFRFDYLTNDLNTVAYNSIQITKLGSGTSTHFKILDENGFINLFDSTEYSSNVKGGGVSSWLLNKVISPDSSDELNFYYSTGDTCTDVSASHTILSGDSYGVIWDDVTRTASISPTPSYDFSFTESIIVTTHSTKRLDSIIGRDVIVQFTYVRDRLDDRKTRIYKVIVLDKASRGVIKQVIFYQGYFGNQNDDNRRLRLDSISVKGSDLDMRGQIYSFKYDTSMGVPPGQNSYYSPKSQLL
jgi:hypothetical protein